jgi:glutamine synthetase
MPANLDLDTLKRLIRSGEIDTVLICMVDMQGRLMGKRYTGRVFRESGV